MRSKMFFPRLTAVILVILATLGASRYADAQPAGTNPQITSVTQVWPRPYQTIQISGSGFGSLRPYDGDSAYIVITDLTQNWSAGHTGDAVTLNVGTWSDSLISISYFDGAYGTANQSLLAGDIVSIEVWNAQTGAGPGKAQVTVLADDTAVFSFPGGTGVRGAVGGIITDSSGNFYGLGGGGVYYAGTAYEVSETNGVWSESVLYNFPFVNYGTGAVGNLLRDPAGNLYGVTDGGGTYTSECYEGCGSIFEITGGTEVVLHTFGAEAGDGEVPKAGLTMDAAGNLWGTTAGGGLEWGTIYELTPNGSGGWNYSTVYEFQGGAADGAEPHSALTLDSAGNLYGTTYAGGGTQYCFTYASGCGTVFKLSPSASGVTESIIHAFKGTANGVQPTTGVTFDDSGNLYGVTYNGGSPCSTRYSDGCGVVYLLLPQSNGTWKEKTLYNFGSDYTNVDGSIYPIGQLTYYNGALYGFAGGGASQYGTIYQLTFSNNTWSLSTTYSFGGGRDGGCPVGSPIFGTDGTLYGVASCGGATYDGVIFSLP